MGVSLTDEQHMRLCPKDVREGNVIDRYLAPAISRFAIDIQTEEKCEPTLDQAQKELRREIVNLHQRWGKVREESQDDDISERVRGSATKTQGFTRIVRRRISDGKEIPLLEWRMIQHTFLTAMYTPRSESTFCATSQFHTQRMDEGTSE